MDPISEEQTQEPKKSNTPMIAMAVVVLVALGGAGFVLLRSGSVPEPVSVPQSVEPTTVVEGAMSEATIEVVGANFSFTPNEIRVKAGQKVKVVLKSEDMTHDFVIDELDVRTAQIPAGQSTQVEFTPETPGEYEFYCSYGNHRAQGMVGKLIVE